MPLPAVAAAGIGAAMGIGQGLIGDLRQVKTQQKLTDQQLAANQTLARYNQKLALDLWEKTSYDAQRKQMEKAGLNVGLMYGMGGGGGATTSYPTQSVTGGHATNQAGAIGMGMQTAMQATRQQAEIENIQANTEKTKADTAKTSGVDTQAVQTGIEATKTNIEKMKAETENAKVQNSIMQFQKQLTETNANIAKGSEQSIIEQNNASAKKYAEEVRQLKNNNEITEKTKDYQIEQARLTVTEQNMRIALAQSGIKLNDMQIYKMSMDLLNKTTELRQQDRALDQKDVQNLLQRWETEFKVGFSTQGGIMNAAKVWNEIVPF